MFKTLFLALFVLISLVAPLSSLALTDYFSTAPGQGAADTLDDVWQSLYNGWGLVPGNDEDLDGCSNYVESIAGTDPRKAGDCLKVGNMVVSGSTLIFYFDAEAGKKYRVVAADNPAATTWDLIAGSEKVPTADSASESIVITKPAGDRKFYKLETLDVDTDNDGVSDWAERELGTNVNASSSTTNASGGAASDGDTLHSLLTLTATPGPTASAYEKEGTAATVKLERSFGTMPLTVGVIGAPGATDSKKSSADAGDYLFRNMADQPTTTVTIPSGQGTPGNPVEVLKVSPLMDAADEVPESLKVSFVLPNTPAGTVGPSATVSISDADPGDVDNQQLFVAFLGREEGVNSTASGFATAVVNGDNKTASISVTFSSLSSEQNTCYLRIGNDLDVMRIANGQQTGVPWMVGAAHYLVTDQAMLDALHDGELYLIISSANYPTKEIAGHFNRAIGSTTFDPNPVLRPDLVEPVLPVLTEAETNRDIYRFLDQCTFGATTEDQAVVLAEVNAAIAGGGTYIDGLRNWLNKQMDPVQTPSPDFTTLVMAADNEEFIMRGVKPLHTNNDPQFVGQSYSVSYDTFGNPMVSNTANSTFNNNHPFWNNRRREWWTMVTQAKAQVRQRMAQALSEITIISENDSTVQSKHYACAAYWDMLAKGAFGKYRTLLEQVSYSPMMGIYLSHLRNRGQYVSGGVEILPDENYAREIMQLFTIGLVLRHPDGSLVLDGATGLPISTYDQRDITELARVMTGFCHGARHTSVDVKRLASTGGTVLANTSARVGTAIEIQGVNFTSFSEGGGDSWWQAPWIYPMKVLGRVSGTTYHDFNLYVDPETSEVVSGVSKRLFAGKAGQTDLPWVDTGSLTDMQSHAAAAEEVRLAHNALAGDPSASSYSSGHQNTPVFISRLLIQRFTTSNPSPGYLYRVAERYRSSNGNLGEVLKAILLDYEARSLSIANGQTGAGRMKEPMIHFASVLRGLKAASGAPLANLTNMNVPFGANDSPMTTAYPQSELDKFTSGATRLRIGDQTSNLGQSPQKAPSVFNWFLPDYVRPGPMANAGLFAPELQIATETALVNRINRLWGVTWANTTGQATFPGFDGEDFTALSTSAGADVLTSVTTLTFNAGNYNVPQTVTVSAVDNVLAEATHTTSISHTVSSTDANYNGFYTAPLTYTLTDNETPLGKLMTITESGGSTAVTEGGATDSFDVVLTAAPSSAVTVALTVTSAAQATLSTSSLTFDSSTWNVPQTVTVTATNDTVTEGAHTAAISAGITSSDTSYNNAVVPDVAVAITDNDNGARVIVTETGGSTEVSEDAGTDTYQIVFAGPTPPSANVTVSVASSGQATVSPASLTFNSSNWTQPQTITVTAVSDTVSEGIHTATLSHTTASTDAAFAGLTVRNVTASVFDNDDLGTTTNIQVLQSNSATRIVEGGMTDTIEVVLRRAPSSDVVITPQANAQVNVSPASLTFNTTNWNVPQTVTLTAVNDTTVEHAHSTTLTFGANNAGGYSTADTSTALTVSIADNEATSKYSIITQSGGNTAVVENGATDTYTVTLSAAPVSGATVTVTPTIFPSGQATISPSSITFTSANFSLSTSHVFTVTATNDSADEPSQNVVISHAAVVTGTADAGYNGTPVPDVNVGITDNVAGSRISITQTNGSTQPKEDLGTDILKVALTGPAAPTANVTVNITSSSSGQAAVSPSPLTFTPANWNVAQDVTVTAGADTTQEGPLSYTITAATTGSVSGFTSLSATQSVRVLDNEETSRTVVSLSHVGTDTRVSEGGSSDTFTVVLRRAPTAPVTLAASYPAGLIYLSSNTLTFTSANWFVPQTVTVTAQDDFIVEGAQSAAVTWTASTAGGYAATDTANLTVLIGDNDVQGTALVSIVESGGSTSMVEGGTTGVGGTATDTYTVVLGVQPKANVTITPQAYSPNNTFTRLTYSPASVTFTPQNWNTAQEITATVVNDTSGENLHAAFIGHAVTSTDLAYANCSAPSINAFIQDNDSASSNGITIYQTGGTTDVVEGGATDTIRIALNRLPSGTVTLTPSGNTQCSLSPSPLTFTTTNWMVPQTVTVTATNDTTVEGAHTNTVTYTASGGGYTSTRTVTVNIGDNDGGSLIITPVGGTQLTEGTAGSYTVALGSVPTGTVTITIVTQQHVRPMANLGKLFGYFANDLGDSNQQKDRIILNYSEVINLYNSTYTASGGNASAASAHLAATKAVIGRFDLLWCGGRMGAKWPDGAATPNERQSIIDGVYNGYSTTRLSTDTTNFNNEVRDRCRIAAYLVSLCPSAINAK